MLRVIRCLDEAGTRLDEAVSALRSHDCDERCDRDHCDDGTCNCSCDCDVGSLVNDQVLTSTYDILEKARYTSSEREVRNIVEEAMSYLLSQGASS